MESVADCGGMLMVDKPKHYLKRFHLKYTSMDKLKELMDEEGFEHWTQLFKSHADPAMCHWYPERPHLQAWLVTSVTQKRVVYERNPYYWKVDPKGNQLPYIDRIVHEIVGNPEVFNIKMVSGEVDMQSLLALADYPLYMENREKGDYQVRRWTASQGSATTFHPNLNCKDPVLRNLFQNRDFRIALSLAIDREEINELCYLGIGTPRQSTVV